MGKRRFEPPPPGSDGIWSPNGVWDMHKCMQVCRRRVVDIGEGRRKEEGSCMLQWRRIFPIYDHLLSTTVHGEEGLPLP